MLTGENGILTQAQNAKNETEEARVVSLKEVYDLDNTVGFLKDMPCGYYAERKTQNDAWIIKRRLQGASEDMSGI